MRSELTHTTTGSGAVTSRGFLSRSLPLLVLVAVIGALLPSWVSLAEQWADLDSRYSHGFLALFAVLYLIWQDRAEWRALQFTKATWARSAILLAGSLGWYISQAAALVTVNQALALILTLLFCVLAFHRPTGVRLSLVIAPLVFALPIWDLAMDAFLAATIRVVQVMLRLTAIEADFDGALVLLPAGVFEIAPTCNGLQIFLAACSTGALLSAYRREGPRMSLLLMAGAGIIGIVANWLRVYTVVMAGYLSDMQHYLVRSEHYTLGWTYFAVGIVLYARWVSMRFAASESSAAASGRPASRHGVVLLSASLLVGPALLLVTCLSSVPRPEVRGASPEIRGWDGPLPVLDSWQPIFRGAYAEEQQDYVLQGGTARVSVYSAVYADIDQSAEPGAWENALWPSDWSKAASYVSVSPEVMSALPISQRLEDSSGRRWVVVGWYWSGDRKYASATHAQIDFAVTRVFTSRNATGVTLLASACMLDCKEEERAMLELAGQVSSEPGGAMNGAAAQ